jgi:choline dehydrogenase-like flavoprotein
MTRAVFGVHNLHVAGSGVFSTSGQADPTLTIVALAIRLARPLEEEARRPVAAARRSEPTELAQSHVRGAQSVQLAETLTECRA